MKPEDWISVELREPIEGDKVLTQTKDGYFIAEIVRGNFKERVSFWMPIVPPPKPDPFETWWWVKVNTLAWGNDVKEVCRRAWDAALKSKDQSE